MGGHDLGLFRVGLGHALFQGAQFPLGLFLGGKVLVPCLPLGPFRQGGLGQHRREGDIAQHFAHYDPCGYRFTS